MRALPSFAKIEMGDDDRELRCPRSEARRLERSAGKHFAAKLPLQRAASVFLGHGSFLPFDQSAKARGWNDRATANAPGFEPAGRNVRVDRCPPKAGRLAGFANAECEFHCIGVFGLHWLPSFVIGEGQTDMDACAIKPMKAIQLTE